MSSDEETDLYHTSTEAKIKSYALLFGFYYNTGKEKILDLTYVHLILTLLIIFDIYNQKAEIHYTDMQETLQKEIQELVNENNVLQKYADIADLNILIKIGLAVEGIDLGINSEGNEDSQNKHFSLQEKFKKTQTINSEFNSSDENLPVVNNINNKIEEEIDNDELLLSSINSEGKDELKEDYDDEPLLVDEPKLPIPENYDLNEKDESNSFLRNNYLQKFIDIIKKSEGNEQEISICNTTERVIQFVKRLIEQIIIFICLCISLCKLNVWTFIYLLITILIIFTKKTMYSI